MWQYIRFDTSRSSLKVHSNNASGFMWIDLEKADYIRSRMDIENTHTYYYLYENLAKIE